MRVVASRKTIANLSTVILAPLIHLHAFAATSGGTHACLTPSDTEGNRVCVCVCENPCHCVVCSN